MAGKQFANEQDRPSPERAPVVRRRAAAPLVVGHAADAAEREADRVADEVIARLHGPDAHVHAAGCGHDAPVARSFGTAASPAAPEVGYEGGELSGDLSSRIEGARGGGRPLDDPLRRSMESAFGTSLSDVRIHTDGRAADLNSSISARAFTTGRDIFFGAGEYRPQTTAGQQMLAHELAHTVQQRGGVQRIHRVWDLKAKDLKLHAAYGLRTIKSRPVWFIDDGAGNEIVVKSENQPIGAGDIVAAMQKKINKVKSVDQRQLTKQERWTVENLIETYGTFHGDASFVARGDYLKTDDRSQYFGSQEDSGEIGVEDALSLARDPQRNIVAMTVAAGESAEDHAESTSTKTPDGKVQSGLRTLLTNYDHVTQLGELMMVDLLLGNQDRVYSGNVGNWFYDHKMAMTLIDHVDQSPRSMMTRNFSDFATWKDVQGLMLQNVRGSAQEALDYGFVDAANKAGDADFAEWLKSDGAEGKQIGEEIIDYLVAGMSRSRRKLLQVFRASKWNVLSKTTKRRKALKKAAKTAEKLDTEQDATTYGGQAPDYWTMMKQRVEWLRDNAVF